MTHLTTPAYSEAEDFSVSGAAKKPVSVAAVIQTEGVSNRLIGWLSAKPALRNCTLVLVHISQPHLLIDEPQSETTGFRLLQELQKEVIKIANMLETCRLSILEIFPSMPIECCIKSGEPLHLLTQLAKNIRANHIVIFDDAADRHIVRKELSNNWRRSVPVQSKFCQFNTQKAEWRNCNYVCSQGFKQPSYWSPDSKFHCQGLVSLS